MIKKENKKVLQTQTLQQIKQINQVQYGHEDLRKKNLERNILAWQKQKAQK